MKLKENSLVYYNNILGNHFGVLLRSKLVCFNNRQCLFIRITKSDFYRPEAFIYADIKDCLIAENETQLNKLMVFK